MHWTLALGISVALNIVLGILLFLKTSSSSFLAQTRLQRSRQAEQEQEALKRLRMLLTDFYREQFMESLKAAQNGLLFDNEIRDLNEMLANIMRRIKDEAGRCAKHIRAKIEFLDARGTATMQSIVGMKRRNLILDKDGIAKAYQDIETTFRDTVNAIESTLKT